jgi:hypothetical protein
MIILDENIDLIRRRQLINWKIHVRQIGIEIGHAGMKDFNEIIPLLHSLRRPTFLTRDHDFYSPDLSHTGYCLVYFDLSLAQTAEFARRFLRHKLFRTQARRLGKVVCVDKGGLTYWQVGVKAAQKVEW